MRVTPTGAFLRNLKKLSKSDANDTITALELFTADHKAKTLNFEPVKSRRGYYTIRSNYSVRVLLRQNGEAEFDVVAVGNHDFVYASYFKK
jgi:hypothetical protein